MYLMFDSGGMSTRRVKICHTMKGNGEEYFLNKCAEFGLRYCRKYIRIQMRFEFLPEVIMKNTVFRYVMSCILVTLFTDVWE